MTIPRLATRLLLGPKDVPASREDFEVVGVFNPGAVRFGHEVVLLVRIAERPREIRSGFSALPRWDSVGDLTIDWIDDSELEPIDARIVRRRADGLVRLNFISHLRLIRCGNGREVEEISDITFRPATLLEEFGVEDARITSLDGRFAFSYVAVSRHGPMTALAITAGFQEFERRGVVFCPENKDVVLFPDRIGGDFAALHRPVCGTSFTKPEIWFARSPDLTYWGVHTPLGLPEEKWQSGRVGAGAPPIRLQGGWLVIYHGNRHNANQRSIGEYCAGAMLLDAADPTRILRRSEGPFFVPETDFETRGFVPNVVFPTGMVQDEDVLLIYYGASDTYTAVAEFSIAALLDSMIRCD